jgi:hypothetical protein
MAGAQALKHTVNTTMEVNSFLAFIWFLLLVLLYPGEKNLLTFDHTGMVKDWLDIPLTSV